ncbi:MAG: hypothetical protein JW742_07780 [Candidatus Aminicenantes bacterium]|nr:hypothetical protein [Candidatus Aminicenantes bacterium]
MNPTGPDRGEQLPIKIDYDRIDVADIMAQIKARVGAGPAAPPPAPAGEAALPAGAGAAPPPDAPEPPPSGLKGRLKALFFKLVRPFAPLQKLLALPTHQELMATVAKLHQTNLQLEDMITRVDAEFHRVNADIQRTEGRVDVAGERIDMNRDQAVSSFQRLTDSLRDLQDVLQRGLADANIRVDAERDRGDILWQRTEDLFRGVEKANDLVGSVNRTTNERIDGAYAEIQRSMEFVKLLHNLSHNIVVEMSKLKIEEEGLKLKTRVMEKDFEFLGRRERALEKELCK